MSGSTAQHPDREESLGERVGRVGATVSLPGGVLAGILAALGGYVAFFGVVLATGAVDFSRSVGAILRPVGNFYYNAQNVPTYQRQVIPIEEDNGVTGELVREFWTNRITGWQRVHQEIRSGGEILEAATQTSTIATETTLPAEVYLLIPVLVLGLTGAIVAWRVVAASVSGRDRWIAALVVGSAVTLGYLLVALLGTFALTQTGGTEGTVLRPARLETLGYGLLYPLVFGTLGAGLALVSRGADDGASPTPE